MSNYDAAKKMIAAFAGQENTIGVPRAFCKFMGSLEGGVFLSQVIFWSDKSKRTDGWFYKSYEEWEEETLLSQYKIGKYARKLTELGVLEVQTKKANGAPTCHYRLDYEKFSSLFIEFLTNGLSKISQSITENSIMDSVKISQSITDTVTETSNRDHTDTPSANAEGARNLETVTETVTLPGKPVDSFDDIFPPKATVPTIAQTIPAGVNPSDWYRQQVEGANERMVQRFEASDQWEEHSAALKWFNQNPDANQSLILRLLRGMSKDLGIEPDWHNASSVKSWLSGAEKLLQIAKGDLVLLREVVLNAQREGLNIPEPYSLVKMTQVEVAKRRSGGYRNPSPYVYVGA